MGPLPYLWTWALEMLLRQEGVAEGRALGPGVVRAQSEKGWRRGTRA